MNTELNIANARDTVPSNSPGSHQPLVRTNLNTFKVVSWVGVIALCVLFWTSVLGALTY